MTKRFRSGIAGRAATHDNDHCPVTVHCGRRSTLLFPNIDGANPLLDWRELTRQVAHLFDAPMRDRIQRGRAESLPGAQAEAGMVPWASNRIAHEKALFEGGTIVRADGADRKQFIAAPDKEHRLAERVTEQHGSVRNS